MLDLCEVAAVDDVLGEQVPSLLQPDSEQRDESEELMPIFEAKLLEVDFAFAFTKLDPITMRWPQTRARVIFFARRIGGRGHAVVKGELEEAQSPNLMASHPA